MSFLTVYNSLFDILKNSSDLTYVDQDLFLKGFKDPIPNQTYGIIVEPGSETEANDTRGYNNLKLKTIQYEIDIYCRVIFNGAGISNIITGYTDGSDNIYKGVLEFTNDVKTVIRDNKDLGYTRQGTSVSAENLGFSFDLTTSAKYLTISINGRTPSGYTQIDCGSATLTGSEVASNIQASLRELGNHDDDGYNDVTVTFNNSTKQFTITSQIYGAESKVTVTAGSTNDCSALLGFDNPTELQGRNIIDISFGTVIAQNEFYPVRFRVIPITILEEIQVS